MESDSNSYPYEGPFERLLSGFLGFVIFLVILGLVTLIIGIGMIIGLFLLSLS